MTRKKLLANSVLILGGLLLATVAGTLLFIGCSDSGPTAGGTLELVVALPEFDELLSTATPPIFDPSPVAPMFMSSTVSDTSISCWTQGNSALLRRAFGADHQMALHRNMRELREMVQWTNRVRRLGDTSFTGIPSDTATLSGTMSVTKVRDVDIPPVCQAAFGESSIRLQYRTSVQLNEQTQTRIEAGFGQDDSSDALLAYHGFQSPDSIHPQAYEHCLVYAVRDRVRDSIRLRGMHIRLYNDQTGQCAMWTYEVTARGQSQFSYRMTWYADDFAISSGVGAFIGSGQRQTQFALRYQQMIPADRLEPDPADSLGHVYRLFGPNYADLGSTLSSAWSDEIDPAKMYRYAHLPVALRLSQSTVEASLNPWSGI